MSRIACIGSRETIPNIISVMERIGAYLVTNGYTISTGNAKGADQAFARGGNSINPKKVELHLPWSTYEQEAIVPGNIIINSCPPEYYELAKKYHPNWPALKRGGQAMMARNIGIVTGCVQVICYLNHLKPGGGGTGQGVRFAKAEGIPVLDLSQKKDLDQVVSKLKI